MNKFYFCLHLGQWQLFFFPKHFLWEGFFFGFLLDNCNQIFHNHSSSPSRKRVSFCQPCSKRVRGQDWVRVFKFDTLTSSLSIPYKALIYRSSLQAYCIIVFELYAEFTRIYTYMLFAGWEVRMVKNCDRGQHFQARGHSFSPYGPTLSRKITCLFFPAVN